MDEHFQGRAYGLCSMFKEDPWKPIHGNNNELTPFKQFYNGVNTASGEIYTGDLNDDGICDVVKVRSLTLLTHGSERRIVGQILTLTTKSAANNVPRKRKLSESSVSSGFNSTMSGM